MYPFFYDWTWLILLPGIILSVWAQLRVKTTYNRYSRMPVSSGLTGRGAALEILQASRGLSGVPVRPVEGELTDHYDPTNRSLSLSQGVYDSCSVAAVGVAAHEVGHAMQHEEGYSLLSLRNAIVPVVNITSAASMPVFFLGFMFGTSRLMNLGILLFSGVLVFHLITLPVEFDASRRALRALESRHILSAGELAGAGEVLKAAAMTYVAATAATALQLARLVVLRNSRGERD